MSRCVRCGLPETEDYPHEEDAVCFSTHGYDQHRIACRDRELANLRSLLRSVTTKLEQAAQEVDDGYNKTALELISEVLETLS